MGAGLGGGHRAGGPAGAPGQASFHGAPAFLDRWAHRMAVMCVAGCSSSRSLASRVPRVLVARGRPPMNRQGGDGRKAGLRLGSGSAYVLV